jgi:hypothetical protein
LCPKPVIEAWVEDNQRSDFGLGLDLVPLVKGNSTAKAEVLRGLRGSDAVVVVNYETAYLLPLADMGFSVAIADEVHGLGAWSSKISRRLAVALADVPNKLGMTGTPFSDGYVKLYGITRFLDAIVPSNSRAYPQSRLFGHYNDFLDLYAVTYNKGHIRIIRGYRNVEHLAETIAPFTLTLTTDEVAKSNGLNYPHIITRKAYGKLSGALASAYSQMEADAVVELGEDFGFDNLEVIAPHILTQLIRLQQLADSGLLVPEAGGEGVPIPGLKDREQQLVEFLDEVGTEAPLVIFTRFKYDEVIVARLVKQATGEEVAHLTGTRDNHMEWRAGKYRILIANTAAGSEGVRLERAAYGCFWSVGFSGSDFEQAVSRLRRIGSLHDTVRLRLILSRGTIDEKIYKAIDAKIARKNHIVRRLREEQTAPRRL